MANTFILPDLQPWATSTRKRIWRRHPGKGAYCKCLSQMYSTQQSHDGMALITVTLQAQGLFFRQEQRHVRAQASVRLSSRGDSET